MATITYTRISDSISLFTYPAKKGDIWHARIKLEKQQGNRRYKWISLHTKSLRNAKTTAKEAEIELRVKQQQGIAIFRKRAQDIIDEYLGEMEQDPSTSAYMLRLNKRTLRYWRKYLLNRDIEMVSNTDFEKYNSWRNEYWQKAKIRHGNAKNVIAKGTLKTEINCMKACLNWAKGRNIYSGNITHRIKIEKKEKKLKQATFSVVDYRKLTNYMRTNAWLKDGGKHGTDKRLLRYREMLRNYVLILANTGMRVGEARNLRWCDITFDIDDKGLDIVRFDIQRGKQGRHEYLGRAGCKKYIERLKNSRQDNIGDNDYLWCDVDGTVIKHFREGFNRLIRKADVEFDSDREKRVPYSLRHSFISMRLRKGVDIFHVARMCNTSVQMIDDTYGHVADEKRVSLINIGS